MRDRAAEIAGFLHHSGWSDAQLTPLAADFSTRRYARLQRDDGQSAILMDAGPDQKTPAFVTVAKLLRDTDISAPEIFAADPNGGLVLMQDFGERNFGRMLDAGEDGKALYLRAADLLVHLHGNFKTDAAQLYGLPVYNAALFASQVELFLDAYMPYALGREATSEERQNFSNAWQQALKEIDAGPQSLMLRDFMPDNLMDLPQRKDWRSVGVLDFQDAGIGPTAYDLASLCETVRRDGGEAMLDEVLSYYHRNVQPDYSMEQLKRACTVLAAQRHMRILGIIARLSQNSGGTEKLAWLPRIWGYLNRLLPDNALGSVREWLAARNIKQAFQPVAR